jgi:putative membrane protein
MWRKSSLFLVLCGVLLLVARASAQTQAPQSLPGYGPWWGEGYGWSFWWMCPVMMLVMFAVMAVVMLAWRHGGDRPWGRRSTDPSLQILSERYARGEIHKDEYEEKKATILLAR